MKVAILHNPVAGDEEHSKKELISAVKSSGFDCEYRSIKKDDRMKIEEDAGFVVAAGGDGTVRKVARMLLQRNVLEKTWPIALLPLGTANNIAATLGINGTRKEIIDSWHNAALKKYDVGLVYGLEETNFFVEGLGFGIFPCLIAEMEKQGKDSIEDSDRKKNTALELLHQIVLSYEPRYCDVEVDGNNYSGRFLMVEIMNTRSIGPNLVLAPDADPGDGELAIVLIPEEYRERFAGNLTNKIAGKDESYAYSIVNGKNISLRWDGTHVHLDGELLKMKEPCELSITLKAGFLQFLIP